MSPYYIGFIYDLKCFLLTVLLPLRNIYKVVKNSYLMGAQKPAKFESHQAKYRTTDPLFTQQGDQEPILPELFRTLDEESRARGGNYRPDGKKDYPSRPESTLRLKQTFPFANKKSSVSYYPAQ